MNLRVAALFFAPALMFMASIASLNALAADAPSDPDAQTPWGLYLTAKEAGAMKAQQGDKVLLVDVREPIEIMFTGFTDMVDVNIHCFW